MNPYLKVIQDILEQSSVLTGAEKEALLKSIANADKQWGISEFKLDRTEKVKRTTAILLEETIEELEQKRKAAEAQSRELEIESSLERVRTQAMSMNKPDNLMDICQVIYTELLQLGFQDLRNSMINIYPDDKNTFLNYDYSDNAGKTVTAIPYNFHPLVEKQISITKNAKDAFYEMSFSGKELKDFRELRKTNGELDDAKLEETDALHYYFYSIGKGSIGISTYHAIAAEKLELLKRFRNVFNLSYQRYSDIALAEAQAKEAQIETGLERVRSRSLAMHHTSELQAVIHTVHKELLHLNIAIHGGSFIAINSDIDTTLRCWGSGGTADTSEEVQLPLYEKPFYTNLINRIKDVPGFFTEQYTQQEKIAFFTFLFEHEPWSKLKAEEKAEVLSSPGGYTRSCCVSKHTSIFIINHFGKVFSEEENNILTRFGKVFEQTYTRFLDLQKAEAQAKEAQIETALERVRSRSMGMQKSEELKEVIKIVYQQLNHLKINLDHAGFVVNYTAKGDWHFWIADEQDIPAEITHPYFESVWANQFNEAKEKGTDFFVTHLNFEEKNKFYNELLSYVPGLPKASKDFYLSCPGLAVSTVLLYNVSLYIENFAGIPYGEEDNTMLMRFGKVFQQTYTRFLDLQKAEAQAREAQIEASLERVRSKTMAMHNSAEVGETVIVMFDELRKLNIETFRCGIGIMNEEKETEIWTAKPGTNGKIDMIIGHLDMHIHPLLQGAWNGWKNKKESFAYELSGTDLTQYFEAVNQHKLYPVKYNMNELPQKIFHHDFYFTEGTLFAFTLEQLTDETQKIFRRFAGVFGQTYRRYLDLKKAEAQAKEAHIENAIEKVRSRTLAMQKSDELPETAAVLFQQLIALGIEPNRLYISIVKNEQGDSEFWITEEDGSKVSTAFSANLQDNPTFAKMYAGWKQQLKSLVIDMQGDELQLYFNHLKSMGVPFKEGLSQKRRVQDIAYFSKGFIGMASTDEQPPETISLLEKFAAVFNLTFTRFNDLKVAEANAIKAEEDLIKLQTEKKRAEDALKELRSTQTQLIQSEKMASLGELTAGIAHEIQNPLNFVNNFSEVSVELLQEMMEEVEKGNTGEAKEIAHDLVQNLEKINHHGKRADAIVKGMLQHSRTSSAIKEPTDINKLADEYLRLAYHGIRAKDKSFNATLKTDFDETIGNINIIPQDIGRVILNLITNAFYAVDEKKKKQPDLLGLKDLTGQVAFEPTVTVSTNYSPLSGRGAGGEAFITVTDNGNGIPKNIIDKIFQPFFTTKPTGQGTGLGLSLAYDIVKAHGGELKVETKESEAGPDDPVGQGTTFIIQLPG